MTTFNKDIAKQEVISIIKEAKYRYEFDTAAFVEFLNKKAKEYVNRANAFLDKAYKTFNLLVAREVTRVRDQVAQSMANYYKEVCA